MNQLYLSDVSPKDYRWDIHHVKSLLVLLSAFQKPYSVFSTKDSRGRQSLSQSKQPRSAATATAQPARKVRWRIPFEISMNTHLLKIYSNPDRVIHKYAFIENFIQTRLSINTHL
jgi:hypothetical protein